MDPLERFHGGDPTVANHAHVMAGVKSAGVGGGEVCVL
jgi:hypothetical protein